MDADCNALRNDPDREESLWRRLHRQPDSPERANAREQLILRYVVLVKYVAWRVAARGVGQMVDREDLMSYGMFGLIDAVDRYDPHRGVPFKDFAINRIHGAIIDELRSLDWAPRSVRFRVRALHNAIEQFEAAHQRRPTTSELADTLGWTTREVWEVRQHADDSQLSPLGEEAADDAAGFSEHGSDDKSHHREDITAADPVLNVEVETTRRLLAQAAAMLPARERAVAAMYWRGGRCPDCGAAGGACGRCGGSGTVPGLTLGEISAVLGISQSWACQLYSNAATMLRENLALLR